MLLHPGCQILSVFGIWTGNAQRVLSSLIAELVEYTAEKALLPFISLAYVGKGAPFRWKCDCVNSCVGKDSALGIPLTKTKREQYALSSMCPWTHLFPSIPYCSSCASPMVRTDQGTDCKQGLDWWNRGEGRGATDKLSTVALETKLWCIISLCANEQGYEYFPFQSLWSFSHYFSFAWWFSLWSLE